MSFNRRELDIFPQFRNYCWNLDKGERKKEMCVGKKREPIYPSAIKLAQSGISNQGFHIGKGHEEQEKRGRGIETPSPGKLTS